MSKVLIALSLILLLLNEAIFGFSTTSSWWTHFTFSFFHANIFHLAINLYCLYSVIGKDKAKWLYLSLAYGCAVIASFCSCLDIVTVGLSGIVFALYGISLAYKLSKKQIIIGVAIITVSFFLKNINPYIHLYAYIFGFLVGLLKKSIERYNYDCKGINIRK